MRSYEDIDKDKCGDFVGEFNYVSKSIGYYCCTYKDSCINYDEDKCTIDIVKRDDERKE